MAKDDEREFRLRPRKPPVRNERAAWASAYKVLMHHARMSGSRKRRSVGVGAGTKRSRTYNQRCAVRVMYAKNNVAGQWRAHGRYVARESATQGSDPEAVGFDSRGESIDIAARLQGWQKAGDERLWKLIVSPEFGDGADMKRLTRDLVSRMEKDLGTQVEWVAAAHYNTEHPHVHVALRGIGAEGHPLHLSKDYVKQGIRHIAEDLCTRQLGHRTELDAAVAQRREVHQHRFTSLDRIKEIEKILQIRHLFTHQNGIVDDKFRQHFPATKIHDEYRMTLADFLAQVEYLVGSVEAVDDAARKDFKLALYF